jgi:hypothetical protein
MTITHVRKWTLALALIVIGAGVALAAVTFDPDSGKGFVGKGDVQLASVGITINSRRTRPA